MFQGPRRSPPGPELECLIRSKGGEYGRRCHPDDPDDDVEVRSKAFGASPEVIAALSELTEAATRLRMAAEGRAY